MFVDVSFPDAVFFVDAMSSFGAVPLNMSDANIDYLVSSANKCIQGVPGFSFALCHTEHLLTCEGKVTRLFYKDLFSILSCDFFVVTEHPKFLYGFI